MNVICSIFNCSVHRYCGNAYLTTSSSSNEPLHQCDECGRRFFSRPKLSRHVRNVHGDRVFCLQCNYSVPKTRSYQLRKHEEIVHNKTKLSVEIKKSAYILPKTNYSQTTISLIFGYIIRHLYSPGGPIGFVGVGLFRLVIS